MACQHDVSCRDRVRHVWTCVDCGVELFGGPLQRERFAIRWGRSLRLEVGSLSLSIGSMVYFRQRRIYRASAKPKGGDMLSPERQAECKRLIHGDAGAAR